MQLNEKAIFRIFIMFLFPTHFAPQAADPSPKPAQDDKILKRGENFQKTNHP
jgi:hypothetical protein